MLLIVSCGDDNPISEIPPGELMGLVYDESSMMPIDSVHIRIVLSGQQSSYEIFTDQQGRYNYALFIGTEEWETFEADKAGYVIQRKSIYVMPTDPHA